MRRTPATVLVCCLLLAVAGCASSAPRHDAPMLSGYGWGADRSGQLGAPSDTHTPRPAAVDLPAGTQAVALGDDFVLALAGSHVWSWGHDAAGQLGDGRRKDRFTPARVDGLQDIVAIAAAAHYAMALASDGSVYTWGSGADGQLGNTTVGPQTRPARIGMPGNVPIAAIAAGPRHAVAVARGGGLFTWGFGDDGELGIGALRSASTPTRIALPHGVQVRQVSIGDGHSVAVTDQHVALGWGSNADGRLGLGTRTTALRPTRLPVGTDVEQVAAETTATLVRRSDGSVLAAGRNDTGQLGDGTTTAHPRFAPVALPDGFRAGALAAGPEQGYAVSSDRKAVLAWGNGASGRLGTGDGGVLLQPAPVTIGAGTPLVTDIVSGAHATMALVERPIPQARSAATSPPDERSAGFVVLAVAAAALLVAVAAGEARRRIRLRAYAGLSGLFDAP